MNEQLPNLRDYLLGRLTPLQESIVEDEYFSKPALFDELRAVEDDLVDEYVRNELSPEERQLFVERFLNSTEREEKVAFARALALSATAKPAAAQVTVLPVRSRRIPWIGMAGAIAAMLVLTVGVWRFVGGAKPVGPSQQAAVGSSPISQPSPASPGSTPETASTPVQIAAAIPTVTLQAGFNRNSGQAVRVAKMPGVPQVRMRAPVETSDPCQVEIQTPEERVVWSQETIKPTLVKSVHLVQFQVPVAQLPDGMYIVRVTPKGRAHADEFAVEVVSR